MDPKISLVVARFKQADILTKDWLMGVKRGWASLLKAKAHGLTEIYRAFDRLIQFVENLEEQVFYARGPYTDSPDSIAEGRRVKELFSDLKDDLNDERNKSKRWPYGQGFEDSINAKQLISKLDKILKLLREAVDRIEKHDRQDNSAFKEFDLYGMKVVVDDLTVNSGQIRQYIRYLDEAYQLLKQKGVAKAWYGTIFIQCADCGGVNENNGGATGGGYDIGKDTVHIFSRASQAIVHLVVHELGHRYWFKQMTQAQRGKFESLVRVRSEEEPVEIPHSSVRAIDAKQVVAVRRAVDMVIGNISKPLGEFAAMKSKLWKDPIDKYRKTFSSVGSDLRTDLGLAMHRLGAATDSSIEVKDQFRYLLKKSESLSKWVQGFIPEIEKEVTSTPKPSRAPANLDNYWWGIFDKVRSKWVSKVQEALDDVEVEANTYIDLAVEVTNEMAAVKNEALREERARELGDKRPVAPVSDYGKSNIDEAWAEAWAHYVTGKDMDRDQIESFKSVLKTAEHLNHFSTQASMDPKISSVVARFKTAGRMEVGKWYKHKHVGETYFLVDTVQKNGGWAGRKVVFDRAHPKAKKDSVRPGGLGSDQWSEIAVADVPAEIKEAV